MSDETYILAIDASASLADLERLRQYVTTRGDFSCLVEPHHGGLETSANHETIGERLHELAPQARFLLTEVSLANSQGWLPEVSWKWLEKRALAATPEMSFRR